LRPPSSYLVRWRSLFFPLTSSETSMTLQLYDFTGTALNDLACAACWIEARGNRIGLMVLPVLLGDVDILLIRASIKTPPPEGYLRLRVSKPDGAGLESWVSTSADLLDHGERWVGPPAAIACGEPGLAVGLELEGEALEVRPRESLGPVGEPPIGVDLLDPLESETGWRECEIGLWRVRAESVSDCDPDAWLVRLAPPPRITPVVRIGAYPPMELCVASDGYSTALLVILRRDRSVLDVKGLGPVDLSALA